MQIYTINNKYSNKDGAFTILPEDLGSSPLIHTHAQSQVYNLIYKLSSYSNVNHTHNALKYVTVSGSNNNITQQINITFSGGFSFNIENNDLNFNITNEGNIPEEIGYVKNYNNKDSGSFRILFGNKSDWDGYDISSDGSAIGFIKEI